MEHEGAFLEGPAYPWLTPEDIAREAHVMYEVRIDDITANSIADELAPLCFLKASWAADRGKTAFYIWLKYRLLEYGCFDVPRRQCHDNEPTGFWGPPMHFFFMHLEETPEMLTRLASGPPSWEELERQRDAARSRLFAAMQTHYPRPIDRTAERVAPDNDRQ